MPQNKIYVGNIAYAAELEEPTAEEIEALMAA